MTFKTALPALLMVLALPALPASAGVDYYPPVTDPLTLEECSACHMAFPAGMLPKVSWDRVMDTLSDHFGEDASLDAASTESIRTYLTDHAPAKMRRVDLTNPPLRISELSWFTHEHGRRLRGRAVSSPEIKSVANCAACHRGAEQGYFEDD